MSLVGKRVKTKDGDVLLILDKVLDKMGKDGPIIDKYIAAYGSGRITSLAPFQLDSLAGEDEKSTTQPK